MTYFYEFNKKNINTTQQINYILFCIIFNYRDKFIILQISSIKKIKINYTYDITQTFYSNQISLFFSLIQITKSTSSNPPQSIQKINSFKYIQIYLSIQTKIKKKKSEKGLRSTKHPCSFEFENESVWKNKYF